MAITVQGEDQLHGIFGKINYLTKQTRHFQSLHEKVFCHSTNGQETTILLAFAAASFYRFWCEKHTATALMVPYDTYHYHLPMIMIDGVPAAASKIASVLNRCRIRFPRTPRSPSSSKRCCPWAKCLGPERWEIPESNGATRKTTVDFPLPCLSIGEQWFGSWLDHFSKKTSDRPGNMIIEKRNQEDRYCWYWWYCPMVNINILRWGNSSSKAGIDQHRDFELQKSCGAEELVMKKGSKMLGSPRTYRSI